MCICNAFVCYHNICLGIPITKRGDAESRMLPVMYIEICYMLCDYKFSYEMLASFIDYGFRFFVIFQMLKHKEKRKILIRIL